MQHKSMNWVGVVVGFCVWCGWGMALADEVSVAVAANFSVPVQKIVPLFEHETGHKVLVTTGSTGQFYAQIKAGAPFQILLAADEATPLKLEQEGLAVAGTRFSYARGQLVLWSPKTGRVDAQGEVLKTQVGGDGVKLGKQDKLAVADAKLAPYGEAAMQVLKRLDLLSVWQGQLVTGSNIGQAYQFVATQNAALGFVALSQVWRDGHLTEGSIWRVPPALYDPLKQDAVLLNPGKGQSAAQSFLAYLRSEKALQIMRGFGYE